MEHAFHPMEISTEISGHFLQMENALRQPRLHGEISALKLAVVLASPVKTRLKDAFAFASYWLKEWPKTI